MPVSVGDGIRMQQAILSRRRDSIGRARAKTFAVNSAVYDHVCDVYALRSVFPRSALRHGAQSSFCRGEANERSATSNRGGGARQQKAAAAGLQQQRQARTNE